MNLSNKQVKHIASLAKIGMTDEELKLIGEQLSQILEQFQSLSSLETENVKVTAHPTGLNTVLRHDKVKKQGTKSDHLRNVPRLEGDFVRVRPVIE